jgi:predicted nucleic acid-binding protein
MMRALIDTDVNLDFILQRQPFFVEAAEIFTRLGNGEFDAYVSAVTPINVYYFTRKIKAIRGAKQAVQDLLIAVRICAVDDKILQDAHNSPITDYEDAVQHECAVAENLDAIVTRNTKDYKNSSIKVYSPSEFLQLLQTV